jgi:ketosteroid isomerase-like protein
MSRVPDIRGIVGRVIKAYAGGDASVAPLADDVVHRGPMLPEPLHGAAEVRQHIADIAPFIARMELKRLIVEGDSAAAIFEYEGLNGVVVEGAEFFRFREGLICEQQVFFDTQPLLRGSS